MSNPVNVSLKVKVGGGGGGLELEVCACSILGLAVKRYRCIHLIPKWRPMNYSFVCMLISP